MKSLTNKLRKSILMVLVLGLLITSLPWVTTTAFAQDQTRGAAKGRVRSAFVPNRVLIQFRNEISEERINGLVSASGARVVKQLSNTGVRIVELPAGADESLFMKAFNNQSDVAFAELDTILAPAEMTPNDPSYSSQWHLPKVSCGSAWNTTSGNSNVIIAILDTGVDANHPDLASRITGGWNFYDDDSNTADVTGHGTSVAGTAAAAGNNAVGVASVAWGCQIMPVRISDPAGNASISTIASALIWAADNGARVANISYACTNFSTVVSAAQYFQSKGGVVTVAAGNDGVYDSTADNPYVLTASASTSTDTVAAWSNTGTNIDVAAPGVNIFTTLRGGGYGSVSGTSVSAPITAAVAALILSANPALNPGQVQTIVKQSADDFGTTGWDAGFGWGRVNASRAVSQALQTTGTPDVSAPTVMILSPGTGASVSGSVLVEATASDNIGVASVVLSVDGTVVNNYTEAPYSMMWNSNTVSNGTHTVTATATDFAGNSADTSIVVTVSSVPGAQPPQISITSPRQSGRVTGIVSVSVRATDDLAVTRVELYVDETLTATAVTGPFTSKWDTKKVPAGIHTLQCVAYDGNGNYTVSASVAVLK